jgi:hypothetical protein
MWRNTLGNAKRTWKTSASDIPPSVTFQQLLHLTQCVSVQRQHTSLRESALSLTGNNISWCHIITLLSSASVPPNSRLAAPQSTGTFTNFNVIRGSGSVLSSVSCHLVPEAFKILTTALCLYMVARIERATKNYSLIHWYNFGES